jgi:acetyl esterase/lipase
MPATGLTELRYDPNAQYEITSRDVEYRHDGRRSWLARVYEPQGPGPFPMLIDVHGGGWLKYDRCEDAPVDRELARHGLVVAALDFRVSSDAPYPASLVDVNYATRWFKAHAREFSAAGDHVGAIGYSSGGHQVMLAAMRPRDPRYAALPLAEAPAIDAGFAYVVLCWPVIDPAARHAYAKEIGDETTCAFGDKYFLTQEAMLEGNPGAILERGERVQVPPALYLQGTADTAIPPGLAQRFASAYAAAGGHIELCLFPGAPHIFLWQESVHTRRGLALIKAFIQRELEHAGASA